MTAPALATIDIGSNSILLLVGRMEHGQLHIELQRKEAIRLGGAMDAQGNLQAEAMERGLECLRRYAALISGIAPAHRYAVATQTLREAHNRALFLQQAQAILNCPVELISGEREAQLIYQGVSSLLPAQSAPRLVIDIGGRSTEICVGHNHVLQAATSCPIGSVSWAQRFFADGSLHADNFAAAQAAAQAVLASHLTPVQHQSWSVVYGASGTAGAISKALHQAGFPAGEITRDALTQLKAELIQAGHMDRLPMQGLREELRPVIGGGVSVMCAVFDALHLHRMRIAQGALRHGIMLELHHALPSTSESSLHLQH